MKFTYPRVEQGFCGICYQVCDVPTPISPTKKFLISVETTDITTIDKECLTDFIQIPCATDQQSSTQVLSTPADTGCTSKICGAAFSAADAAPAPVPVYSK